jgi:hypothetical protein
MSPGGFTSEATADSVEVTAVSVASMAVEEEVVDAFVGCAAGGAASCFLQAKSTAMANTVMILRIETSQAIFERRKIPS